MKSTYVDIKVLTRSWQSMRQHGTTVYVYVLFLWINHDGRKQNKWRNWWTFRDIPKKTLIGSWLWLDWFSWPPANFSEIKTTFQRLETKKCVSEKYSRNTSCWLKSPRPSIFETHSEVYPKGLFYLRCTCVVPASGAHISHFLWHSQTRG